jgi:biotin synthase
MDRRYYSQLADISLAGEVLSADAAREILTSKQIDLLPLLNAAYEVRREFVGKEVTIHIINNSQNGHCPEDCHYCAQAKPSKADIVEYPLKSDDEILAEAKNAYEKGAHRYCMVFAGRGPSQGRVDHLARLIREIKAQYPIEICVSTGLLDQRKAKVLKDAGLDRLNHNLNTSERYYPRICTTHSYHDRLNTLQAARQAGLQLCSGVILGMGEDIDDIIETMYTLRKIEAESIPVNFFVPIDGVQLKQQPDLLPEYCLRVLCLYRFLNPRAEIRVAAGRELRLRSMEVMALYPANSLFLDGYLNARGAERGRTFQMIKDAGFTVQSEYSIDELLANEPPAGFMDQDDRVTQAALKGLKDLRPHYTR